MQAYVLHFKKEWSQSNSFDQPSDIYESWCTERQAYVSAAEHLLKIDSWPLDTHRALTSVIKILIDANHHKEAVDLINECSAVLAPVVPGHGPPKITIKIAKSDYRGSPFE